MLVGQHREATLSKYLHILQLSYTAPASALELFAAVREPSKPRDKADWHYLQFRMYHRQSLFEDALVSAHKFCDYALDCDDSFRLCHAYMALSVAYTRKGSYKDSLHYAQLGLAIALDKKDNIATVKLLHLIGNNHLNMCEYTQAVMEYASALEYHDEEMGEYEKGDILANIAAAYLHQGKYSTALRYVHEAIAAKEAYHHNFLNQNSTTGYIIYAYSGYDRVAISNENSRADVYYNTALCYERLGDMSRASEFLVKALEIKEKLNDHVFVAHCYNELGNLAKARKEWTKALGYFQKGCAILGDSASLPIRGYLLLSIAAMQLELGSYQEAKEAVHHATNIFVQTGDRFGEIASYLHRASCLKREGKFSEALAILNDAVVASTALSSHQIRQSCLYDIGLLYQDIGNASLAVEYLHQALALAQEISTKNDIFNIHYALSHNNRMLGNLEQALEHLHHYTRIKDEIFNEESDQRERNLLILHEVEKHKREAEQSRRELERIKAELHAKARELAEFALRIIEKEEFLSMIETGLRRIYDAQQFDQKNKLTIELIQKVRAADTTTGDWEVLRSQFQTLQHDFIMAMSQRYPEISPTELKVCTLLRMNLRTKEIAAILHINAKTVENHRQSVRKKMGLDRDANLIKELLDMGVN